MCLILFAVNPKADQYDFPAPHLVVAANRDEFHQRASASAAAWQDKPQIIAGRDLEAGGTWLGVSTSGRFAAVTNFAERLAEPYPPLSRGKLTSDFLDSDIHPKTYLEGLVATADQFRGFNLLLSDGVESYYFSNRELKVQKLDDGFYGLSNQLLDCDWPKVIQGRDQLSASDLSPNSLLAMLSERDDSVSHHAKFIVGEQYGTRTSSIVHLSQQAVRFEEQNFDAYCQPTDHQVFDFKPA